MRKISVSFLLLLMANLAIAREPENLAIVKHNLVKYHDSGAYMNDIANVIQKALRYLELRVKRGDFQGKPAIVMDIDETALSNYPDLLALNFGGTKAEVQRYEDMGHDDAIPSTLKLFRFAREHHIAVIFITARFAEERKITEENLHKAGYTGFDGLIFRDGKYRTLPAAIYKAETRKQLEQQGYDILLNIGDQKSDLQGGYADESFKLPNPYYFTP